MHEARARPHMTRSAQQIATISALILCVTTSFVADAAACQCASPGSACIAVNRANAVFVGRVTGLTGGVQFEVVRAVAGVALGPVTVGNGPGTCALHFIVGNSYIVYANRDQTGMLFTNMCTRTRPLSDPHTRADIAYFDRRERNLPGVLLTGVVSDVTDDLSSTQSSVRPLAGIRITVSSQADGGSSTTSTRADGSYELTELPLGRLRIAASLPSQFEPPNPVTVIAQTNGCVEADIAGRVDGRIRGQLLDEGGRPARGNSVQLADAAAARTGAVFIRTMNALTDEQGMFEF